MEHASTVDSVAVPKIRYLKAYIPDLNRILVRCLKRSFRNNFPEEWGIKGIQNG